MRGTERRVGIIRYDMIWNERKGDDWMIKKENGRKECKRKPDFAPSCFEIYGYYPSLAKVTRNVWLELGLQTEQCRQIRIVAL